MKITKRQLRRIIRESIECTLLETSPTKFKGKKSGKFGKKMQQAFNMTDEDLDQFLDSVEVEVIKGGKSAVNAVKYVVNKEYRNLLGMPSNSEAMDKLKSLF